MPGPGKYEIRSQFKRGQSVDGAEEEGEDEIKDPEDVVPFGSRQQVCTYICTCMYVHRDDCN